jgi:hypothetical protein
MILLILIFTIKSLWLNYFYSTSLCYLFQMETIGLLVLNQDYKFINKSILEILLIGFIGIPSEIDFLNNFSNNINYNINYKNLMINSLLSLLISLIIVTIIKLINYYYYFKKIEKDMITKILIKFFITNYLPLLLLNGIYIYYNYNIYIQKNIFIDTFNIYFIIFLIFVIPSYYLKILYGNKRYIYKKKFNSLFIRFKPKYKLWFLFLLLSKNIYFLAVLLKILGIIDNNYIIYGINLIKIYLEFKNSPYMISVRNDNKYNNLFNIINVIFMIINEIHYWIKLNFIEYIKLFIILKLLIIIIYLSIRNIKLNKQIKNDNNSHLTHFYDLDI